MGDGIGIQLAFFAFSALIVGSALLAAVARRIVHSAFALLATFFGVAGIYAVLGSVSTLLALLIFNLSRAVTEHQNNVPDVTT